MLIAPPTTTKLLPKLHHHLRHQSRANKTGFIVFNRSTIASQHHHTPCAPSHYHPKQLQTSIITTTHNHQNRHTSVITASDTGGTKAADVVVNRWRKVNWDEFDIMTAVAVMGLHLLCGFAPFTFNLKALHVAIGLDLVSRLLGINISYHRNLTHKSFKLPKWLEYTFAYCGVQALQGSPIDWVRAHRFHHQYVDTEKDPHSPIKGFWFSHVLWMFDTSNTTNMLGERNNIRDLEKQFFYRFLSRTYIAHPVALALVLYALGGLPFIVWGMGVRIVLGYHITWLVNSICHGWGDQRWDTGDLSLNNTWIGILGFEEGWHNNHHAFKYSARHGLEWWQVDVTWYVIRLLEVIGLASDVKLPTPSDIQRKTTMKTPSP